jgi:hypothetical protein
MNVSGAALVIRDTVAEAAFRLPSKGLGLQGKDQGRVVDVTTEGADRLIEELAKKYIGEDTYPFRQPGEVRVTIKIAPEKINELGWGRRPKRCSFAWVLACSPRPKGPWSSGYGPLLTNVLVDEFSEVRGSKRLVYAPPDS